MVVKAPEKPTDPAILRARELFEASGKTLDEVGLAMGFAPAVARKSVWQLLNRITDPKVSTLRNFAAAIGVPAVDLFVDAKKGRAK
jgi:transcriptional regulator with XRE-family HTH domain